MWSPSIRRSRSISPVRSAPTPSEPAPTAASADKWTSSAAPPAPKADVPIIALPSTAKNGTISRIAPILDPGAGVVTSRADVHYVVTEHGVAYLHGKTLRQRAEALIAIADPKFRDELTISP
jgi:hypothetical protein